MIGLMAIPELDAKTDDTCPLCGRTARESILAALRRIAIVVPNYSPRGENTAQRSNT